MCPANKGKRKTKNNGSNRTTKKKKRKKKKSEHTESYQYLWILEVGSIKHAKMKEKINKEYLRRTRKLFETKLHSRNLKGINTWAVLLVRYSGSFFKWTREELQQMEQRTRKFLTTHNALHRSDDIGKLHVSRKEGERGHTISEDSVDASIKRQDDVIKKRREKLITATRNNADNTSINRTKITRKQKWEEKQQYGHSNRQTSEISREKIGHD